MKIRDLLLDIAIRAGQMLFGLALACSIPVGVLWVLLLLEITL